ncbi:MAG: hypothetical protein HGA67_01965 [Candidatus Yonathbacteria bacterium]|nr:hypothetical protein [Candidatus Yonathbacteria bacterium]
MDIIFFITLFALCGIVAMIAYRGWELSRGVVVHAHPHAIKHAVEAIRIQASRLRENIVDVWFEYGAPPLARLWIKGMKTLHWSILRTRILRVYGRIRGHVAPVTPSDKKISSEEPSEFLQHVQEHKKKTTTRKKRTLQTREVPHMEGVGYGEGPGRDHQEDVPPEDALQ